MVCVVRVACSLVGVVRVADAVHETANANDSICEIFRGVHTTIPDPDPVVGS